jgi:hypothetical protein
MILNIAKVTMANHHVVIFQLIQILGPFSNLTKKVILILYWTAVADMASTKIKGFKKVFTDYENVELQGFDKK